MTSTKRIGKTMKIKLSAHVALDDPSPHELLATMKVIRICGVELLIATNDLPCYLRTCMSMVGTNHPEGSYVI